MQSAQLLKQATLAAGKTKIICSGGAKEDENSFLERLYHQITTGEAQGCAIGRNIHQKKLDDAIKFCNAVATIVVDGLDVDKAKKYLE